MDMELLGNISETLRESFMGPFWVSIETSLGILGTSWGYLGGHPYNMLCACWGHVGDMLGACWGHVGDIVGTSLGSWVDMEVFVTTPWFSENYKSYCSDQEKAMYFVRVTNSRVGISRTRVFRKGKSAPITSNIP